MSFAITGKLAAVVVVGLCANTEAAWAQQQSVPAGQAVRHACSADFQSLCPGVQPGGGRIVACLQQNAAKLSPDCQKALEASRAARQAPKSGS